MKRYVSIYLQEAKQVGILYHFTHIYRLRDIIKSNFCLYSNRGYVSFTRNPSFKLNRQTPDVRIVIDGDRLSQNNSVRPTVSPGRPGEVKYSRFSRSGGNYEAEEIVRSPVCVLPFVIRVDVLSNNYTSIEEIKNNLDSIGVPCNFY